MNTELVKIVVFVPKPHADVVRDVMGKIGAGKIGNYSFCTFSSDGVGRFKPENGAHPSIGEVGKLESVVEERIESVVSRKDLKLVVEEIKKVHPYEEVALDVYPLETIK